MQKINYQAELEKIIKGLNGKPKLLLHACCGPCSSYVMEYLASVFDITVLYYNPNIYPQDEYQRRLKELKDFLPRFPPAVENKVRLVEMNYDPQEFYTAVQGLEQEPEKGGRCTVCYRLRMERAAQYAKAHGFVWFTTTLSVSPLKDPIRINQIGEELAAQYGLRHLPSEFKKRDGYKRSLELSREYGLYRQDYCGCEFSARARGKA